MRRAVAWVVAIAATSCGSPPTAPQEAPVVVAAPSKPCSRERDVVGQMLGTLRFRPRSVERLAISADGRVLMTTGSSGAEIWDARSGERLRTISTWLGRVAMAGDGRRVATRDSMTTVQVIDVNSGEVVWTRPGDPPDVAALALDRSGETLALALATGEVELWSLSEHAIAAPRRLEGKEAVRALAFSPAAPRLVVAGAKGRLELWDVENDEREVLATGEASVLAASYSADGGRMVSGDAGGVVRIFDAAGKALQTFRAIIPNEPGEIRGVAVNDGGTRVLVGTWSGVVGLFAPPKEAPIAVLAEGGLLASGVAFTPDGSTAVGGVLDGAIRFWDAGTGRERPFEQDGNLGEPDGVAWSADGHRAIVAAGANAPHVWDMRCGEITGGLEGHSRRVTQVAATRDGSLLATGGNDGWLRLWDGRDLTPRGEVRDHLADVSAVAFSDDGRIVASGGRGGSIVARDTERLGVVFERPADESHETVLSLAVSAKRGLVLAGDAMGKVTWLDIATGAPLAIVEDAYPNNVRSIAFSPDGRRVATAASDELRIYDAASAKNTVTFSVTGWSVSNPAWFEDGKRLAFGDSDGHLWVVDAVAGRVLRTARIEDGDIATVALRRDEKTLLSGHGDTTMKLWDLGVLEAPVETTDIEVVATPGAKVAAAHPLPVSAAKACPDGGELPACARTRRGKAPFFLEEALDEMGIVRFSADGKLLAVGGGERVEILELPTGRVHKRLPCCTVAPIAAAFSPDGKWLVLTPWAQKTQVWEVASGRQHEVWSESAVVLAVSSDGSTWAGATREGEIFVSDRRGRDLQKLPHAGGAKVQALALSPTGKQLLARREHGDAELWDLRGRKRRWSLFEDPTVPSDLADSVVSSVMFGPNGSVLVVAGDRLYSLASGAWKARAIPLSEGAPVACAREGAVCVEAREDALGLAVPGKGARILSTGAVDRFAMSEDGAWAAVARGSDLALWDLARAQRVNAPAPGPPEAISITRGGTLLTLRAGEVRWWRLEDEAPSTPLPFAVDAARTTRDGAFVVAHDPGGLFVVPARGGARRTLAQGRFAGLPAVSEDARRIAAVRHEEDRAELVVVELATGRQLWAHPLAAAATPRVALSPRGDRIALGDEVLEIWAVGGSREARIDVEYDVRAMAFTADGAAVITAGDSHLDLYGRDGKHLGFVGDHPSVWDFDLSEDGRILVSGGLDGFVRVFDLDARRLLAVLAGHRGSVEQVAVAHDRAVTLEGGGTLIEWNLKPWLK